MYRCCITAFFLFCGFQRLLAQPHTDTWKGFERVFIKTGGHEGYYIKPSSPLPGNPWIWRASFPDWHTDMDSLLLTKGMYVAFVSIDNRYGDPYAMQVWDQFYYYLTDSVGLARQVALEGVSRGGLYTLAWAKRNPDKVNFIYGETPVCDIKSWPGGKESGKGDTASWRQFKEIFNFTEEQALAFNDNPIDHLEALAAFKVPILHVIGLDDKLAPVKENSDVLIQRYTALGAPAFVYPVTEGPQELFGHHFPIPHPEKFAGLVLNYAYPVKSKLPYSGYINLRSGLNNFYGVVTNKKEATVAFLGGSITYNPGWRDKVCKYLKERFPDVAFHFIAAGIPSLGSLPHTFRFQKDVLGLGKPDLLFVEAAVNDRGNGTDSLTQVRSLEGIIRQAKNNNPLMDIVMMEFADPAKTADFNKRILPAEIYNHELVAEHYRLPSINLAKEVSDKMNNGEFTWADDFKDLHPSPFGQELYFETIKDLLHNCFDKREAIVTRSADNALPVPLNTASFEKGNYYALENAKYSKDWVLDKAWKPTDSIGTREGFVNVPMLVTTKAGAALSLSFKGTAIGMAIISGADAGIVEYSIDNAPYKSMDLYTEWSGMLHLPWYVMFGEGLKDSNHILHIKVSENKNAKSKGNACRIVHFLLNG